MSQQINDFTTNVQAAFAQVQANLSNIATDQQNLADQIQALKNQLGQLSPEDQAALDGVLATAQALAVSTKTIADQVPDMPVQP